MRIKRELDKDFVSLDHLKPALERYSQAGNDDRLQEILLHSAFCCEFETKDYKSAIDYFVRAIELDPESNCLKVIFDNFFVSNMEIKKIMNDENFNE